MQEENKNGKRLYSRNGTVCFLPLDANISIGGLTEQNVIQVIRAKLGVSSFLKTPIKYDG